MTVRRPQAPRRDVIGLSDDQFRVILDTIHDAVHVVDRDLRLLFMNKYFRTWLRELGLPGDGIGQTVLEAFPFLSEGVLREYRKVIRAGTVLVTEESTTVNGSPVFTETQKIPILEHGRVASVVTIIRDLTVRTRAEADLRALNRALDGRVAERSAQLRESEEKYRTLLNHLPVGVYRTTPGGKFIQANQALARMLGYGGVEALKKVNIKALYQDPRERGAHLRVLRRKNTEPREFVLKRRDGTPIWVRDYPRTIEDRRGHALHYDGVLVDISKRKRAEQVLRVAEEHYRDLVENANSIILRLDPAGRIIFWNRFAERFFGFKSAEVLGKPVVGTIVPGRESTGRDLKRLLQDICRHPERHVNNVNENVKKNGERVWIAWTNRPFNDESGHFAGALCVGNDMTRIKEAEDQLRRSHGELERWVAARTEELVRANRDLTREVADRKRAEGTLVESEERFRVFFDRNVAASYIFARDGRLLQCNEAFLRLFGYASVEEAKRVRAEDLYLRPGDRRAFLEKVRARQTLTLEEMTYRSRNGSSFTVLESAVGVFDARARLTQVLGHMVDVTQLRTAEDRLAHLLHHDPLTGLPNRGLLMDRMEQAIARARRNGRMVGLAVLDLDRFNAVNDTFGHRAGDSLIQALARRLQEQSEDADTVAHLDGDAFALLFADLEGAERLAAVQPQVEEILAHPFTLEKQEVYARASVGITLFPQDAADPQGLLKNAEVAMYQAKEQGGGHSQYYRPEMNVLNLERMMMETGLRKALERGEFRLHYQPLVDLRTRRIVGLEALMRWQHPELGLLYPASFIPLAEERGVIVPMGEWALQEACAQAKRWVDQGFALRRLNVNLSARHFQTKDLAVLVGCILADTGLDPGCLELELTESTIMANVQESIRVMQELKGRGVHLAIDDFGTGYSSLLYLKKHFPIDTLKIDRFFLKDVTTSSDDAAIVEAILAMGRSLRLEVVAEGVELPEQVEFLKRHGCHVIQGYFFSRPQEPGAVGRLLKAGICPGAE